MSLNKWQLVQILKSNFNLYWQNIIYLQLQSLFCEKTCIINTKLKKRYIII